jgi:hypothetical protein
MKLNRLIPLAALAVASIPDPARAQSFHDYWIQCTPGSLQSCARTEIGFASVVDPSFGPLSLLLVRLSNLQGLPGFESGPRGFSSMWINGIEGTPPPVGPAFLEARHHSSEGNASIGAELGADDLNHTITSDGRFNVQWNLDANTLLFGCDGPPQAYLESHFLGWDTTCGGTITYALRLRGDFRMASQPPSIQYDWRAWADASDPAPFGTGVSCTTGVDCVTITPEPATLALLASGLVGIAGVATIRKRRKPVA